MSKKKSKEKKGNKKKIIIIISIFVILLAISGIFAYYMLHNNNNDNQKQVPSLKKVEIETGMSIDEIKNLIKKDNKLSNDVEISFKSLNDSKMLVTKTKYYKNDKEVSKEEAVEIIEEKEVLKEGYTKKEEIAGTGKYEITIKDNKNNKVLKTTMTIKDTKMPDLVLKDVEIEENTTININDFIESCTDNSNEDCSYEYTDEKGNKIDNIDLSVGERKVYIVAIDPSKNRSNVKTANLKVNAKQEENKEEQPTQNNTQSTTSNPNVNNNNQSTNASSDPAQYDTSNPIVAKALSLVGSSMDCTGLVENALNAAGKSLTRYDVPCSHPIFQEPELALLTKVMCTDPSRTIMVGGINIVKHFGTPVGSPAPGDVLFYDNGGNGGKHIAIYIGNNQAVHGGWKGNNVVIYSMYVPGASSPRAYRM